MDLAVHDYEASHSWTPENKLPDLYIVTLAMQKMVEDSRLFDLLLRYRTQYDRSMHRCQRALFAYRESMSSCDPLPPVAPVQTDEPQPNSPETPSPEPDMVIDSVNAIETSETEPTLRSNWPIVTFRKYANYGTKVSNLPEAQIPITKAFAA